MKNKNLKKEIYSLVVKYYNENHKIKPFIPGETYIQYAGRVYDEKEMISLVDIRLWIFDLPQGDLQNNLRKNLQYF